MLNKLPFLLNEEKISEWVYYYCQNVKDDPEIRKHITHPGWAYNYCRYIGDNHEVRKHITGSYLCSMYNKFVKK